MNIKELPAALCFLGSGVVAALTYPRLSQAVPVHWGLDGAPDRFGSRFEALFVPPLIFLGAAVLLWAIEHFSPRDRSNGPVLRAARLGLGMMALLVPVALALNWDMARAALIGTGLLLALLGNVLGRAQPSVFVGLRTPWVYLSRRAWFASQRRSALWLTALGGVLAAAAALCPREVLFPWVAPVGLLIGLGGTVGWLAYASYRDWKEDPAPEPVFRS